MGPFKITQRIGQVAYKLELPSHLGGMHDVFHISKLKKYNPDSQYVLAMEGI